MAMRKGEAAINRKRVLDFHEKNPSATKAEIARLLFLSVHFVYSTLRGVKTTHVRLAGVTDKLRKLMPSKIRWNRLSSR